MKYDITKQTALGGVKRHACTTNSDAFPYIRCTCKWF